MNVVIEGMDASGKSTLARKLGRHLGMKVVSSQGPEKYPGEVIKRTIKYLKLDNRIFDRHPIVSQPIYGSLRERCTVIPDEWVELFRKQRNFFIYCECSGVLAHETKAHDSPAHLQSIAANASKIEAAYEEWAETNAHARYRPYDDERPIVDMIRRDLWT